jgi:hypothetical protein
VNPNKNSGETATLVLRDQTIELKDAVFSANKNKIRQIYVTSLLLLQLTTGHYNSHLPNSSLNKDTYFSVTK